MAIGAGDVSLSLPLVPPSLRRVRGPLSPAGRARPGPAGESGGAGESGVNPGNGRRRNEPLKNHPIAEPVASRVFHSSLASFAPEPHRAERRKRAGDGGVWGVTQTPKPHTAQNENQGTRKPPQKTPRTSHSGTERQPRSGGLENPTQPALLI